MLYFQVFLKKSVFLLLMMTVVFFAGCFKTKPFMPPIAQAQAAQPNNYKIQSQSAIYHTVQSGETLGNIAKRYRVSYKQLANWNNIPAPYIIYPGQNLRINKTIATAPAVRVVAPKNNDDRITRRKPRSYSSKKPNIKKIPNQKLKTTVLYHQVKPNETLVTIAKRYQKQWRQLASWNNLKPPYRLKVGQRLRIFSPPKPKKNKPKTNKLKTKQLKLQKAATFTTQSSSKGRFHTIMPGDTLYSVSNTYGSSLTDIARWNNLQPPYTLTPGKVLRIASQSRQPIPQPIKTTRHNRGYHKIAPGDTLYSLSRRYGYSVSQLATWNKLSFPYDNLSVGQVLRVYPPSGIVKKVRYQTGATSSRKYHQVRKGETLYSISRRYGRHVNQVATWNRLFPPYTLLIGQRLRVSP